MPLAIEDEQEGLLRAWGVKDEPAHEAIGMDKAEMKVSLQRAREAMALYERCRRRLGELALASYRGDHQASETYARMTEYLDRMTVDPIIHYLRFRPSRVSLRGRL